MSIVEYRDDLWEGLVRARNRLTKTGIFTGLFGYIIFSLAIVAGAQKEAVIAAAAFFLVGASVGLFNQLLAETNTESAIEDYGLASARLLHIPLFSGLAALGGVVFMAVIPMALNLGSPTPIVQVRNTPVVPTLQRSPEVSMTYIAASQPTTQDQGMIGKLRDTFNLDSFPLGLINAAIFGLTPCLLVDRLKKATDRCTEELKTTKAAESAAGRAG